MLASSSRWVDKVIFEIYQGGEWTPPLALLSAELPNFLLCAKRAADRQVGEQGI
jgi:hypothetical protein